MRAIFSYGVAGLIVLGVGGWLATGTLVAGGNGPGNGEKQIIALITKGGEGAEVKHHGAPAPTPT